MTPEKFSKMFKDVTLTCNRILNSKNKEYSRGGDKLSNFKKAAALQDCTPVKACGTMMAKHTVSVFDYINDHESGIRHDIEKWDEKIIDHINYLLLLRGLLLDNQEEK